MGRLAATEELKYFVLNAGLWSRHLSAAPAHNLRLCVLWFRARAGQSRTRLRLRSKGGLRNTDYK